jgi:A/G-specific adenine glycosylase
MEIPDSRTRADFARQLLAWFERCARDLPWRRHRTPYRVWLAEVMLQQTQVETVIPYYERFLTRFPTVESLTQAPLADVLKLWEGLGYYARARNLHAAARQIVDVHGGQIPDAFEALLELPGVGLYTAGAVASIAFGRATPAVDGNVRRVLSRVFEVREDVTRSATKRKLRELAADLLPQEQSGPFNEALMELGATVCTPRNPRCDVCPINDVCRARALDVVDALPVKRKRAPTPHYHVAAAVTTRADGRVLLAQRHIDDMLGGLWEFPGGKQEDGETLSECLAREMREELDVTVAVGERLTVVEHAYTHFRMTLHAFRCCLVDGQPRCLDCADFRWALPAEMAELPMSVADRKVVQALIANR